MLITEKRIRLWNRLINIGVVYSDSVGPIPRRVILLFFALFSYFAVWVAFVIVLSIGKRVRALNSKRDQPLYYLCSGELQS